MLRLTPYASAELTLTDNYNASSVGGASDAITRLSGGVSARLRSAHNQGSLDYTLSLLMYARNNNSNTLQHQLTASLESEWFERQGFLSAGASIQQVARSAFGAQPVAGGLPGANTTELRSVQVSPRWRSQIAGLVVVNLQGYASASDADDSSNGDGSSTRISGSLTPFNPGMLSWALDGTHETADYELTRNVRSTRGSGALFLTLNELDLRLSAQAGREQANYTSLALTNHTTWGAGLVWKPSPRTQFSAQMEERAFGKTHQVALEYRTPRTIWRAADSRGISTGANTLGIGQRGRAFDILFAQFASIEPDFGRRADLVDAYLLANGLSPNAILATTFLRSATTIDDRQDLSVAWRGPRSTMVFNLARSQARRLDTALSGQDDLDQVSVLRQTSATLLLSHRLTTELSASLTGNVVNSLGLPPLGTLLGEQRSQQRGLSIQLNGRNNAYDSWSLGLRHTQYETNQAPYAESALIATYGMRF